MFVDHVFHFDAGDVFAAGNNDVFAAVFNLHVAVGVLHAQVAGVEPAAGKGFFGGVRVFQVAFHYNITAEHQFAHAVAIPRHRLHVFFVPHLQTDLQMAAHALARFEGGALGGGFAVPVFVRHAHGSGAVGFGEAVNVGDVKAHLLHARQHGFGRRSTGNQPFHAVFDARFLCRRSVRQRGMHDGRGAVMAHLMFAD